MIEIPADVRDEAGLNEGVLVDVEVTADGVLLRPVIGAEVEIYTPERKAEFF